VCSITEALKAKWPAAAAALPDGVASDTKVTMNNARVSVCGGGGAGSGGRQQGGKQGWVRQREREREEEVRREADWGRGRGKEQAGRGQA
jgi:hypothetical protein